MQIVLCILQILTEYFLHLMNTLSNVIGSEQATSVEKHRSNFSSVKISLSHGINSDIYIFLFDKASRLKGPLTLKRYEGKSFQLIDYKIVMFVFPIQFAYKCVSL